jgi:MFS family permease
VSLAVIIGIRSYLGFDAFQDWGWRLPFIISLLLVAIAIWIRLSLGETPIFQDIKARGRTTTNPWREAFLSNNFRYAVIASVVVPGQGCVWYRGQLWALYFLQTVKKLDVLTSSWIGGAPGSVGYALIYPIVVPAIMFLIAVFVMPETRKNSIWEEGAIEAARARG